MDTDSELVARRVVSAMKTAKVSEREMVRRTGIPRDRLRSRLQGQLPLTVNEVFAIARALDVPPSGFIPEETA